MDRGSDPPNRYCAEQFPVMPHKFARSKTAWLACRYVGHVDGEEVAGRQEALDCGEVDVVRVAENTVWSSLVPYTAVSAAARVEDGSEPMIVCSRFDLFHTGITSIPALPRACTLPIALRLMGEAIAHADGESWKL